MPLIVTGGRSDQAVISSTNSLEDVGVHHRVLVGVHDRDQPLLVEAGRQQHPTVDAVDPLREREVEVGRLVVAVVPDRAVEPRDAALRPEPDGVRRNAGVVDDRLAGVDETVVASDRRLDDRTGARLCQRRLDGGHHERVAVVRAEVQHGALGDQVHVLGLAAERTDGEAATDRLGERDQVGLHAQLSSSRRRIRP